MAEESTGPKFAVVTGASSGIGLELARVFAENGADLLLVADDEAVHDVASVLTSEAKGVTARALQADLATREGTQEFIAAVFADGRPVDLLALNAGFANAGPFLETDLEADRRVIGLNISSVVESSKRLLPPMVARGSGRVLITSSVAATQPGPYYATYAASKSFLLSFAEAVRYELKDSGVTITALMPGPTDTQFFESSGMQDTPVYSMPKDDPADVAREAYDAMMKGKDHVVTGSLKAKAMTAASVVLPQPAKAAAHASMTKPQDDK